MPLLARLTSGPRTPNFFLRLSSRNLALVNSSRLKHSTNVIALTAANTRFGVIYGKPDNDPLCQSANNRSRAPLAHESGLALHYTNPSTNASPGRSRSGKSPPLY